MGNFIEKPASLNSLANRKPLFGFGINDADYLVTTKINGKRLTCPYYRVWANAIKRSYCEKYQDKNQSYLGCSVSKEWFKFSNFRKCMEVQDWKDKALVGIKKKVNMSRAAISMAKRNT